jgi:16S rRNA (uracil1498-N3)-methyltransferase
MDWVIQKATELGVTSITPINTERTNVKLSSDRLEKKQQHWQQVAISACEQCTRNTVPTVKPLLTLEGWLADCDADQKFVLHHRSNKNLDEIKAPTSIALLIGPEGGLTADEIAQAEQAGFDALTLGPRVLRTETAPLAAISVLQHRWGDM